MSTKGPADVTSGLADGSDSEICWGLPIVWEVEISGTKPSSSSQRSITSCTTCELRFTNFALRLRSLVVAEGAFLLVSVEPFPFFSVEPHALGLQVCLLCEAEMGEGRCDKFAGEVLTIVCSMFDKEGWERKAEDCM